jgi:hypothetical protein
MFAQSFSEYGPLAAFASAIQQMMYFARVWIRTLSPTTWVIIGVVLLVLFAMKKR